MSLPTSISIDINPSMKTFKPYLLIIDTIYVMFVRSKEVMKYAFYIYIVVNTTATTATILMHR